MQTKVCSKCKEEKPLDEFHIKKGNPDGYRYKCKECKKQYDKQYYQENREERLEYNKQYHKENREKELERMRQYHQENREERLEYKRQWRQENPEYQKQWYQENREKKLEYSRQYYQDNPGKVLANTHRYQARKRNLPYNWTENDQEFALEYWSDCCCYCGSKLNGDLHWEHFIPLSSDECPGTIPENMLPSCASCNTSKRDSDPYDWCTEGQLEQIEKYFKNIEVNSYLGLE